MNASNPYLFHASYAVVDAFVSYTLLLANTNFSYVLVVSAALILAAPVNDKPSIVKPVAVADTVHTPFTTASSFLAEVLGLIPLLGPTIVKLAIVIVIFSV